jgi:hypothetical protein
LKKAASKEAFKREWKLLRKTLQETRTGSVKRRHERKVKVTTESEEWTLFLTNNRWKAKMVKEWTTSETTADHNDAWT